MTLHSNNKLSSPLVSRFSQGLRFASGLIVKGVFKMIVELYMKAVYGKDLCYPMNLKARLFCSIAGTKTLSQPVINAIKALGFKIKWVTPKSD